MAVIDHMRTTYEANTPGLRRVSVTKRNTRTEATDIFEVHALSVILQDNLIHNSFSIHTVLVETKKCTGIS